MIMGPTMKMDCPSRLSEVWVNQVTHLSHQSFLSALSQSLLDAVDHLPPLSQNPLLVQQVQHLHLSEHTSQSPIITSINQYHNK